MSDCGTFTMTVCNCVGPGVPGGGTTGEVLAKKSDTSYDTEWITNTGGGGIPDAPTDGQAYVRQSATWVIGLTLTEANAAYDLKGSAFSVQTNLNTHEADTSNPHSVTAVQVGADPTGSAAAVQANLDTHEADLANPHQVSDVQVIRPYLVPQVLPVDGSGEATYDGAAGVNATLTLTMATFIGTMTSFGPSSGTLIVTQAAGGYPFTLAPNMTVMSGDPADIAGLADGKVAVLAWTTMDGSNFYVWITTEP